ncbi:hypothetical protein KAU51_02620 [Candidatus Parcubacteria bacterium]|nr:hypothetical protein [Candidatus Parcubacteria bacterium]
MKRFIFATIFILVGLFLSSTVFALTVSPVRIEITSDPGEIVKGEILLINEHKGTKTFYSSFENFEATGETGAPTFVPTEEGLATWIEIAPQVTLDTEEKKEVSFTIKIPQNADSGGHFAAIFWSTSPLKSEKGGAVSVSAKVGILVLLKVTGEIEEGMGLLEFSTKDNQKFFDALPVNFIFRFRNSGGDRVKPEGEITIKNIFGKVAAFIPANRTDGNVLPQSIRRFETTWEKIDEDEDKKTETEIETDEKGFIQGLKREKDNFAFGRYTAELNLESGIEKTQASFSFFVIPWRISSLVAVFLIILLLLFIKGIKTYKKRVFAQAMAYANAYANANAPDIKSPKSPKPSRRLRTPKTPKQQRKPKTPKTM